MNKAAQHGTSQYKITTEKPRQKLPRHETEIVLMWIASMPALTKLGGRRPISSWLWQSIAPHNDREVHVACIPAWDHHHLGWILARGPIVTQGRRNIKNLGGDKP